MRRSIAYWPPPWPPCAHRRSYISVAGLAAWCEKGEREHGREDARWTTDGDREDKGDDRGVEAKGSTPREAWTGGVGSWVREAREGRGGRDMTVSTSTLLMIVRVSTSLIMVRISASLMMVRVSTSLMMVRVSASLIMVRIGGLQRAGYVGQRTRREEEEEEDRAPRRTCCRTVEKGAGGCRPPITIFHKPSRQRPLTTIFHEPGLRPRLPLRAKRERKEEDAT